VRVVILGGGFGGVAVAQRLERLLPRVPSMDVTIVSRSNALLFTPMLAEVASRSLEPNHVGVPVRAACPRTRFRLAKVDRIDTEEQLVHLRADGSSTTEALPYDHLVLALGRCRTTSTCQACAPTRCPSRPSATPSPCATT
jgi:NADH dehydrogenase